MKKIIDLSTFAEGGVSERFNYELQKVLENIKDPNTDPTKKRKIQLNITIEPNENRNHANISVTAKTTIAPAKEISGDIIMDYDADGKITGAELKSGIPGQTFIDNDGDAASDKGEKINELEQKRASNVVAYK